MSNVRLKNVLNQVKREVILNDGELYKLVGVKWYGNGLFIREEKAGQEIKAKKLYRLKEGDFVYNRLFAWKSSFALVTKEFDGLLVSNEFPTFEIDETLINKDYLLNYILLPKITDNVNRLSGGMSSVSRKRLKETMFLDFMITLPSIQTQNEIVKKFKSVEGKFFDLDSEISNQQELLKKLRQSILQDAVEGKLTASWREQNPDVESAAILLEKIKAEKEQLVKEKKIKKQKALPVISDDEIPFDIPNSWEWCYLAETSINRDGDRIPVSLAERERKEKIYDYYGASGAIDKIDGYTHEGDFLLIGEDGANLVARSTPIAFVASGKFWVNNHAHVLQFINDNLLNYLKYFINAIDLKPYITGGFQPKLSQTNLNKIKISIPPLEEQEEIVKKIESLFVLCDELEEQINGSKINTETLMQAVLKEAFEND